MSVGHQLTIVQRWRGRIALSRKRQDAYDLLAPVYAWFTEGFDTADWQEAKELLAVLT